MTRIELIGRSYVDMDNDFGELYCELKELDMKAKDGFVKRKKRKQNKRQKDEKRKTKANL